MHESEVAQSCLILRNPLDYSLPGSSVHGSFQARVLEWVTSAFSNIHIYMRFIIYHDSESRSFVCNSLWPHGISSPWTSLGQNTGVGSLSLLQGSSQPRDQTQVSCITGRFFTVWATREAHVYTTYTVCIWYCYSMLSPLLFLGFPWLSFLCCLFFHIN